MHSKGNSRLLPGSELILSSD